VTCNGNLASVLHTMQYISSIARAWVNRVTEPCIMIAAAGAGSQGPLGKFTAVIIPTNDGLGVGVYTVHTVHYSVRSGR